MPLKFGSFDSLCQTAALVICPLVGTEQGIAPTCYSRNVDIGGTLMFQPATTFIHVVAIVMTIIMILHIRSKYTAVGRKEIVTFFWIYLVIQFLAIFLDSGIIPTSQSYYAYFAAIYTGLVTAAYTCILINGFVGFQFAEDGTALSLWGLRITCLVLFGLGFFLAIATFKGIAGMRYDKATPLWIIYVIWPVVCVAVYVVSQFILVLRTLEDRWPIGDIVFGIAFYVVGMTLIFAFSTTICDAIKHYIDGLFFGELCVLLSVMMVYKYWDSITREDLEFSVGSKEAVWEVKDPLLAGYSDENPDPSNPGSAGTYASPSTTFNAPPSGPGNRTSFGGLPGGLPGGFGRGGPPTRGVGRGYPPSAGGY